MWHMWPLRECGDICCRIHLRYNFADGCTTMWRVCLGSGRRAAEAVLDRRDQLPQSLLCSSLPPPVDRHPPFKVDGHFNAPGFFLLFARVPELHHEDLTTDWRRSCDRKVKTLTKTNKSAPDCACWLNFQRRSKRRFARQTRQTSTGRYFEPAGVVVYPLMSNSLCENVVVAGFQFIFFKEKVVR